MVGSIKGSGIGTNLAFTPTQAAHQTQYGGGMYDGFITKFSPNGEVVWATFFGGTNDDIIESITIDENNKIILSGFTSSSNNISTNDSFRPNLIGNNNSFLSKFSENGALIWSTYLTDLDNFSSSGADSSTLTNTSVTTNSNNDIFVQSVTGEDNQATPNTFQTDRQSAKSLISKFSPLGVRLWSTYYGINESYLSGLCVNQFGLYVSGRASSCNTTSTNYFATANCYQTENFGECGIPFISKFNLAGQREWSTYFGGNNIQDDIITSNSIKCFGDNVYFTGKTYNDSGIATIGSFQGIKDFEYGNYLVNFNSNGQKIWGTYFGLNILNNYITIQNTLKIDMLGNIYISGVTNFQNNISTLGCFQDIIVFTQPIYNLDAFAMKFNNNGERIWGTYFGGISPEYYADIIPFDNYFYIYGFTQSMSGISTANALQPNYNTNGIESFYDSNIFLSRFDLTQLSNPKFDKNSFSIFPNPNSGRFTISFNNFASENSNLELYDLVGHKIMTQKLNTTDTIIETENLSTGIYFAKISSENGSITKKIIIE